MKTVEVIKANTLIANRNSGGDRKLNVGPYCRVSTDDEEQLDSYKSQMIYYTEMVRQNPNWNLVDIYADKAITGTQSEKRENFQRLINDCLAGRVDMVITKSISRFARNTLDTLKYVRMLKEKNIAVMFEEENINTLTMDGELLLTILSSVAQQEVENISANVKKGLKMKMQRGELVGFQGCLGYDYDKETKTISINEEEAEIVRYIFKRYIAGAGGLIIAKELRAMGVVTKRGFKSWPESTVMGIIKNEKYKGDILMGKTFTVNPITKRRLSNLGEEDKFYLAEHHEPIISEEIWEKAQEIRKKRGHWRKVDLNGKREPFSRKYAFSCMIKCGFCGGALSRRSWNSGTKHQKTVWECVTATKGGRRFCPESRGVEEAEIERAFVQSYQRLYETNKDVLDEFLQRVNDTLASDSVLKELEQVKKDIIALQTKQKKLLDMALEGILSKEEYEVKKSELDECIEKKQTRGMELEEAMTSRKEVQSRIVEFKEVLQKNPILENFDRTIFESIVKAVIIGGYDDRGEKDPYMITFVYKMGFSDKLIGNRGRTPRIVRTSRETGERGLVLADKKEDTIKDKCSFNINDTRRDVGSIIPHREE